METLKELMQLLDVSEEDAIKSILTAISPPNPATTRQSWTKSSNFGNSAPETKDLWIKLVEADFRCTRCSSQMRLTFNHIDSDSTNHQLDNLEVLCFSYNKSLSSKETVNYDHHYKLAMAAISLWKQNRIFPTNKAIEKEAEVTTQVGAATYLLKYLENRLSNETNYND